MKFNFSKLLVIVLIVSLLSSFCTAIATDKAVEPSPGTSPEATENEEDINTTSEEVVYAIMDQDGSPNSIYTVVILNSKESGDVKYYGPFLDAKNLTDTSEISLNSGSVSVSAPKGRFYFQSMLASSDLPWNINVEYSLNGEKVSPEELRGANGSFEMHITTSKNEAVNPTYYDAFLMQITVTLNSEKCKNIVAEGATIANAGADKQVAFAGMPGADTDVVVSADVTDFEMKGITFAAVPFNMSGQLDMLSGFTGGLEQLTGAIGQISYGAAALSIGADSLKGGAKEFGNGLHQLSGNSAALRGGSAQILAALNQINSSISGLSALTDSFDMSTLAYLPGTLTGMADALDAMAAMIPAIPGGTDPGTGTGTGSAGSLLDGIGAVSEADLAALLAANPGNPALQVLISNYYIALAAREALASLGSVTMPSFGNLSELKAEITAQSASLRSVASTISALLSSGGEGGDGLSNMVTGFGTLASEYSKFNDGLVAYTNGVDALASNWDALYGGVDALSTGANQLSGGASQLSAGASAIPEKIEEMMESFGADYTPESFLSPKNEHCVSVQFVITTKDIELPEPEPAPTPEPHNTSFFAEFWDRLLGLFK